MYIKCFLLSFNDNKLLYECKNLFHKTIKKHKKNKKQKQNTKNKDKYNK